MTRNHIIPGFLSKKLIATDDVTKTDQLLVRLESDGWDERRPDTYER